MKRYISKVMNKVRHFANYGHVKYPAKLPRDEKKDELQRIKELPRFSPFTTNIILEKKIHIPDAASFLYAYKEIFQQEIYKFLADTPTPYILDCGANIGVSIIYFKREYPQAEIIGFEPDKNIFKVLSENVVSFGLKNVKLVNRGLWNEETTLRFYSEGADGGRIARLGDNRQITEIHTTRLREYLNRPVDFLKIDIEGAETLVLEDCQDLLYNVKNLFVEYHSYLHDEQSLDRLLSILKKTGFRYVIQQHGVVSLNPFVQVKHQDGMDILLNISAYRIS